MSWLYKYFRLILSGTYPALEMHEADLKFASGSTVTIQSGGALAVASGATQTVAGTSTGIVQQSTATPYFYKVSTFGTGSTVVDFWVGPTSAWSAGACYGPTPSHYGDILLSTSSTGGSLGGQPKMYIASAISASSDWKLFTSA